MCGELYEEYKRKQKMQTTLKTEHFLYSSLESTMFGELYGELNKVKQKMQATLKTEHFLQISL